jgi:hypothetical protein
MISSAPAICGTRLGLTKDTASMRLAPAASSRRIISSFSSTGQGQLLVLQPVARADLDDLDEAAHGRASAGVSAVSSPASSASSPGWIGAPR